MYRIAEATMSDIKTESIEKRSHFLKSNQSWSLAETVKEYLTMFTLENILTGETDCVNPKLISVHILEQSLHQWRQ